MSNKEISEKLNISLNLISAFARKHNLKKGNSLLKSNSKIPLEKREYVLNHYETMLTKDIAKETGLDVNWIRSYAYLHGVRRNREIVPVMCENKNGLTNEQKKFIIENYSKLSNRKISKIIGIEEEKIHSYASNRKLTKSFEAKLKKDNYLEECLKQRNNENYHLEDFLGNSLEPKIDKDDLYISKYGKYSVNQNYFEVINNEWKAYWLGFLYADGCVQYYDKKGKSKNTVSIKLKQSDKGHIEKFLNSLQSNHPVKDFKTNYKDKYSSGSTISNKKLCEDLIKHGCIPNKSLVLKFPNLREDLIRHFIRGYFDGDGCISLSIEKRFVRVCFVGTEDMLKNICHHFSKELGINIPVFRKKNKDSQNNIYDIQWGNFYTCRKIYQYLYKDCNIYLDRKLEKFDTIYCLE